MAGCGSAVTGDALLCFRLHVEYGVESRTGLSLFSRGYEDMSFREYRQTYRPILRNGRPYFVAIYNATKSPPLRTPLLLTPLSPCKFLPSPPSAVRGGEYSEERSAARAEGHLPDRVGLSLKVKSEEIDLSVKKKAAQGVKFMVVCKIVFKREGLH